MFGILFGGLDILFKLFGGVFRFLKYEFLFVKLLISNIINTTTFLNMLLLHPIQLSKYLTLKTFLLFKQFIKVIILFL